VPHKGNEQGWASGSEKKEIKKKGRGGEKEIFANKHPEMVGQKLAKALGLRGEATKEGKDRCGKGNLRRSLESFLREKGKKCSRTHYEREEGGRKKKGGTGKGSGGFLCPLPKELNHPLGRVY